MSNQTPALFRQEGDLLDYTPNAVVSAGDVIVIGNAVTVAMEDIAANALGAVRRRGVIRMPKDNSVITMFQPIFWFATGSPLVGIANSGCANASNTGVAAGWA